MHGLSSLVAHELGVGLGDFRSSEYTANGKRRSTKVEDSRRLFEYDLRVLFQQKQFRDEGSQNYLVALLVLAELREKNNVNDHITFLSAALKMIKKCKETVHCRNCLQWRQNITGLQH